MQNPPINRFVKRKYEFQDTKTHNLKLMLVESHGILVQIGGISNIYGITI